MVPNSDNTMARFLFAILKQKDLKDIDWNRVAQDPVLKQPISNGHAARMRYARFRATVTGHEPQKRACQDDKARVTKPKKGQQSRKSVTIKSESAPSLSSYAQYSPASAASPYTCDAPDDFHARFLTPCSDDMSHVMSIRPAAVERGFHPGGLAPTASVSTSPDYLNHTAPSPVFSAFDATYDLAGYEAGSTDGQHELGNLGQAQPSIDCGQAWNDRYHDVQLF
ncbi:hypothetical protein HRG_002469 [Hirsutella rhossiliensis]|uniref:Myb-like DNA-binding domain-containing protein n=1 Tax=Hirsutella rhossiliensis TaxID=111463 RepID=A0A9P8N564_9HYPO|nr:uncharacterized protein HRG_02469 [Hirsutella rhossiliensis]KAH0967060.1 hypothetical protein HRG_02469 [Hirsutella rhossiliensis]